MFGGLTDPGYGEQDFAAELAALDAAGVLLAPADPEALDGPAEVLAVDWFDDTPQRLSRVEALEWEVWAGVEQDDAERAMLADRAPGWVFLAPGRGVGGGVGAGAAAGGVADRVDRGDEGGGAAGGVGRGGEDVGDGVVRAAAPGRGRGHPAAEWAGCAGSADGSGAEPGGGGGVCVAVGAGHGAAPYRHRAAADWGVVRDPYRVAVWCVDVVEGDRDLCCDSGVGSGAGPGGGGACVEAGRGPDLVSVPAPAPAPVLVSVPVLVGPAPSPVPAKAPAAALVP
jgi:hypothetical protein